MVAIVSGFIDGDDFETELDDEFSPQLFWGDVGFEQEVTPGGSGLERCKGEALWIKLALAAFYRIELG